MASTRRPGDEAMIREFGRRLAEARQARGLSQETLGEIAGYQDRYISNLERAERQPTMTTLVRLATALDIGVAELLDGFVDPAVQQRRRDR